MIKVTQQQRDNALEARDVMWPSVPPENVSPRLGYWRHGKDDLFAGVNCGTIACFGGWCAVWPPFVAQGVSVNGKCGAPMLKPLGGSADVGRKLFGRPFLFTSRYWVNEENFAGTDHQLVTHRLNWLIDNSEVVA